MVKESIHKLITVLIVVGFIAATFGLLGCLGGSSGSTNTATENESGDLIISLTDAKGDFASYTVDVVSLTLTKQNGAVVETLPVSTTVDFAQYTEMTEFLTAGTIPNGIYTQATMTLDYQNADIQVENEDGDPVAVDTIRDEDGNDITTITVSVYLGDVNAILIAPGIPAHLSLDFDLNASNKVEFDAEDNPELTVSPVLLADVNRESSKIHRLRGLLNDVSVDDSSFNVIIRPFYHFISKVDKHFGMIHVKIDNSTVYSINKESYQGQSGLVELNELPEYAAVVVIGDLKFSPYRFEAREVLAGSSVPGGTMDAAKGNIVSRDGNIVVIKGASLIRDNGNVSFNKFITVVLGDDTVVKRQLSKQAYEIADISIGQKITVHGIFSDIFGSDPEIDATNGYVRMHLTTVRGTVNESVDDVSPLIIDLQSIGRHRAEIFDFTGTGIDPDNDTDIENFEVDTGVMDIASIISDSPVKIRGFVNGFGQAPEDFTAWTIVNISDIKGCMKIHWNPASTTPFEQISDQSITFNLLDVGCFHHLGRGHVVTDLTDLSEWPTVQPGEDGIGIFTIKYHQEVQLYASFSNFVSELEKRLANGQAVRKLSAVGLFDDETVTLTLDRMVISLQ